MTQTQSPAATLSASDLVLQRWLPGKETLVLELGLEGGECRATVIAKLSSSGVSIADVGQLDEETEAAVCVWCSANMREIEKLRDVPAAIGGVYAWT